MRPVSGNQTPRSMTISTTVRNRSHPETSDTPDQAAEDCHRVTRQSRTEIPLAALDEDLSMDDQSDMSISGDEDDNETDDLHRSSSRKTTFSTQAHSIDEPSTPSSNLRSSHDTEAGQCCKRQCMQLRNQHSGLEAHVRATNKRIANLTDKNKRLRDALRESEASKRRQNGDCNVMVKNLPQHLEKNIDATLSVPPTRPERHVLDSQQAKPTTNQANHRAIVSSQRRRNRRKRRKAQRDEAQKVSLLNDELERSRRELQALKASISDSRPISPTQHDEMKTTRDMGVQCLRKQNAAPETGGGGGKHRKCADEEEELLRIENLQLRDEVRRLSIPRVRTWHDIDGERMVVGTRLW